MIGEMLDTMRRSYQSLVRGTFSSADDSKKMQEITFRNWYGQIQKSVEYWQPYGITHVPLPPDANAQAEVLVAHLSGAPEHPIAIAVADRRHRPKNLKPGEVAHHDDQKQHVHLTRSGINTTGKKVTVTAGDKPETKDHELNEQLKGLAARVAQAEKNLHGLFDVTSKFREIVQGRIPEVAQVANILNQAPKGLEAMASAIEGKAQAYLQQQVKQALGMFLNPTLGNLASLLGGNVEGLIGDLKGRIAGLLAANPIVGAVDDLVDELAALKDSGAAASAIADRVTALDGQIKALTQANPVVAQVAQLRGILDGLIDQAGPALNFLEPQKRLVQGLTRSMRFGGPG